MNSKNGFNAIMKKVFFNIGYSAALPALFLFAILLTGCKEDREPTAPVEIQRPQFLSAQPENGALVFPLNGEMKMKFTEKMNTATFANHFFLKDSKGNSAAGSFTLNDSFVIFKPAQALTKSTVYTLQVKGRLRDLNNNSIEINGDAVLNDTTTLYSGWFYTEGDYSNGGFYHTYLRDRKTGLILNLKDMFSVSALKDTLSTPAGFAVTTDGAFLLVTSMVNNQVNIINTRTGLTEKKIDVGYSPSSVAIFQNFAYVLCPDSRSISVINISSRTIEKTYTLTFAPVKLAVSNDGATLYTFDQVKRELVLISAADGKVTKRTGLTVTQLVSGEIRFDVKTSSLFICDAKGLKLRNILKDGSGASNVISYSSTVEPLDIILTDNYYYVAAGKNVFKYDRASNAVVGTLSFSSNVKALGLNTSGELLYVVFASTLNIFDTAELYRLKEFDLGSSGVESILINPAKF